HANSILIRWKLFFASTGCGSHSSSETPGTNSGEASLPLERRRTSPPPINSDALQGDAQDGAALLRTDSPPPGHRRECRRCAGEGGAAGDPSWWRRLCTGTKQRGG
ncbi:hypothetical protein Droror1_Dr00018090, partial [Drosera rotundifolia]